MDDGRWKRLQAAGAAFGLDIQGKDQRGQVEARLVGSSGQWTLLDGEFESLADAAEVACVGLSDGDMIDLRFAEFPSWQARYQQLSHHVRVVSMHGDGR